jgi:hypothetical protein
VRSSDIIWEYKRRHEVKKGRRKDERREKREGRRKEGDSEGEGNISKITRKTYTGQHTTHTTRRTAHN